MNTNRFSKCTTLLRSIFHGECADGLSVSIDPDHQLLSSFASAEVTVMGEIIGHFPGDIHVCGVRLDNAIIVRICLSSQCAVEGVIKGLSDEDYSQCKRKVISGKDIKGFLANGVELQNANAVTFTPTMLFVNALVDKLRSAIRYYSPLSLYEVRIILFAMFGMRI